MPVSLGPPRSLTARLVVTAVGLVAVVCLLLGAATTVSLYRYLDGRLTDQVGALPHGPGGADANEEHLHDEDRRFGPSDGATPPQRQELSVAVIQGVAYDLREGTALTAADSAVLSAVREGSEPRTVSLDNLGSFRVVAYSGEGGSTFVTGLRDTVDQTVRGLLPLIAVFVLLGTALAGLLGTVLVRRQLAPLQEVADTAHEVAMLPLASGDVDIPARVPDRLTDERTEVGQVGAALNTLLGHVEGALGARYRSEQQVRQFVADASHELRTPLATIKGYAELARRTHAHEPEALLRALEKVEAEGVRMTSLVEDLLLLARLDAGRPLAHDEVDLTRLVLEAVSDARVVSPHHRWRLELPDDPVAVPGDELRLRQVLVNLLSNAARHTPARTTVTVTVAEEHGRVPPQARVVVHDDGPGVPTSLQPTVFERFTRADVARTREVGGAGLGLSLARAIARAHGGDLDLESRPGSTTFSVRLPATAAVPAAPVAASSL